MTQYEAYKGKKAHIFLSKLLLLNLA